VRQVLDVRGGEIAAGIEDENAEILVPALAVDLFRSVGAEHAGADDDDVERRPAVHGRLVEAAADEASEDVRRELGILKRDGCDVGIGS
jgi:hypothetical protein